MFKQIRSLFRRKSAPSDRWRVLERMEPLLAYERLQALKLTAEQQPIIEGLIDGSLDPGLVEGVQSWAERTGESSDGVAARLYALQKTLGSETTTFFFAHGSPAPVGRFPKYLDENTPAIVFNDEINHFQITTARELLESRNIRNFTMERFDPSQLQAEMQRRLKRFSCQTPKKETPSKLSLTLERPADESGQLIQPLDITALAEAIAAEGYETLAESIELDKPIVEHGLHRAEASLEGGEAPVRISIWVVPPA